MGLEGGKGKIITTTNKNTPNQKFLCKNTTAMPEQIKVGATALNFSTEIVLADRIVTTS